MSTDGETTGLTTLCNHAKSVWGVAKPKGIRMWHFLVTAVIPSVKEYLMWMFALIGRAVVQLNSRIGVTSPSCRNSKVSVETKRLLVSVSSPEYKTHRKHVTTFILGFLLGSFLYITMYNFRYAHHYETRVMPLTASRMTSQRATPYRPTTTTVPRIIVTGRATRAATPAPLKTGIPRIVHQGWRDMLVPDVVTKFIQSWGRTHAHWMYMFWTGVGVSNLVREFYNDFSATYESYKLASQREQVQRYVILHNRGGIYADLDIESVRSLDPLLNQYPCIVSEVPAEHRIIFYNNTGPNVSSAFMACRPKHPFLKFIIKLLPTYQTYDNASWSDTWRVKKSVGSIFLSDALELYRKSGNTSQEGHVHVISSSLLMPRYNVRFQQTLIKKCANPIGLSIEAQQLCHKLQTSDFSSRLGKDVYTIRHWVNFNSSRILYGPKTSISTIVANSQAVTGRPH